MLSNSIAAFCSNFQSLALKDLPDMVKSFPFQIYLNNLKDKAVSQKSVVTKELSQESQCIVMNGELFSKSERNQLRELLGDLEIGL